MAQKKISELDELLAAISASDEFIVNNSGATQKVKASLLADSLVKVFAANGGAGLHNVLFRGKNLGTSYTAAQMAEVQAGTFNDLWIGDYWVIGGVTWRIAHFDYWIKCGDTECTTHHIVVVPDTNLYTATMNATHITIGGYAASLMRTSNLATATTTANSAFSNHVLTIRRLFTNAVTSGRPSSGSWYDSAVDLMDERMVYGSRIHSPAADGSTLNYNYTTDYKQLAIFALAPQFICNRAVYWLLDVVSTTRFARVYSHGDAADGNAADVGGVRPAIAIS